MATDATGTPTPLGIPTYNLSVDAPSGNGNTAQMNEIDTLLQARATLASPTFTGVPLAPTPSPSDNSTKIATTAYVQAQLYAPLASPALTGSPTAPTPSTGDNSTLIATTAFVKAQGYITSNAVTTVFGRSGAVVATAGDYTAAQVTNAADKASASPQNFTGSVVSNGSFYPGAGTASISIGGTFNPNYANGLIQRLAITTGGGTVTISAPSTPPDSTHSGLMAIEVVNTGGSNETLSWSAGYSGSTFSLPTLVNGGGQRIMLLFVYDPISAGWFAVGQY